MKFSWALLARVLLLAGIGLNAVCQTQYVPSITTAGSIASIPYSTTAQTINLTATVLSAPAVNSGYVWFALLGSRVAAPVVNGTATTMFTVPGGTPQGSYPVEVTYVPDNSVHITAFNKTNNIYTNLDEEFPHTGTGTPGSGVGTPNASYLYIPPGYTTPSLVAYGDMATYSTVFELTSNANGQDFAELSTSGNNTLSLTTAVPSATAVHLLTAAYSGADFTVTFTGDGGATETFTGVAPDFCKGGTLNTASMQNGSSTNNVFSQSVLEVQNVGACGTGNSTTGGNNPYFLYEHTFVLSPSFQGQNLHSIFVDKTNGGALLVLGITVDPATGSMLASSADNTAPLVIGQASSSVTWANVTAGDAGPLPVSPTPQSITLTAHVTGAAPVDDGTVSFTLMGSTLQASVNDGAASTTFSVPANTPAGSYPITATYTPPGSALDGSYFLTNFSKGGDIYTQLNQQYPNSGPGTPGANSGTANAGFFYNPLTYTPPSLVSSANKTTNGSNFLIASNSNGEDFEQINYGSPLLVPSFIPQPISISLLTAAYTGTNYNVTVTADGGATETFTNVTVPNFCSGGTLNNISSQNGSSSNNVFDQSVLEVQDVGGCGTGNSATGGNQGYFLYEQTFLLTTLAGQNLTSVTVSNNTGNGLLLLGATANGVVSSSTDVQHQLIVVQATVPTITWSNPADIGSGTPLGAAQLNATASVPGQFVYNPPAGTVLPVGSNQPLTVTFLPTDSTNYTIATDTVYINVDSSVAGTTTTAGNASATYNPLAQTVALTASVTSSSTVNAGSVTFTVLATSVSANVTNGSASALFSVPAGTAAGSYTIQAQFNPATGLSASSDNSHTLTITQAVPVITWATPAAIYVGTALSATQLNATANVPGSFTYNPASGTVLQTGTHQALTATFTPTDKTDYSSTSSTVYIDVNALQSTSTFIGNEYIVDPSCPGCTNGTIAYGGYFQLAALTNIEPSNTGVTSGNITFSAFNLSATSAINSAPAFEPISPLWTLPASVHPGTYTVKATFNGAPGLAASTGTEQIQVVRATPAISWGTPADIPFGTPLSATQLNAIALRGFYNSPGAPVAGTFTYNPPLGTVLQAGQGQKLSVTFTPTDSADYTTATASVLINVLPPAVQLSMAMNSAVYPVTCPEAANSTLTSCFPSAYAAVKVTFTNSGSAPVQNLQLSSGALKLSNGTISAVWVAPQPNLGTLAPGASLSTVVNFLIPSSNSLAKQLQAGTVTVIFSLNGTYTGGSFQNSLRFPL